MTKESIHLIKGYLGYEVPCIVKNTYEQDGVKEFESDLDGLFLDSILYELDFKLILRPLEDLTDKELIVVNNNIMYNCFGLNIDNYKKHQFKNGKYIKHHLNYIRHNGHLGSGLFNELVEYFHSIHIDYQNLIGQGLAIKKGKE